MSETVISTHINDTDYSNLWSRTNENDNGFLDFGESTGLVKYQISKGLRLRCIRILDIHDPVAKGNVHTEIHLERHACSPCDRGWVTQRSLARASWKRLRKSDTVNGCSARPSNRRSTSGRSRHTVEGR